MAECDYAGCNKPVPQHILDKGGRFCGTPCRQAAHREQGKAIPGRVQSVSRCGDGACVVVLRVPAPFYTRLGTYPPGTEIDLIERD